MWAAEREAALESVKLTREGLRDPEPAKPVAHGEKSKKFMMEFISRVSGGCDNHISRAL